MNSQDDPSGEFAYMVRNGALHFRLEFYDYGPAKVRQMIDEQAEYNFLYAEYQYWEIGRDEAWFKEQCRELLNDQVKIKREILLVWPMSTDGSVFAEEQLDVLSKYKAEVVATMPVRPRKGNAPPNLEFLFTEMPDPSVPYILSIDTSGGVGRDYTAFTLSHPDDMRTVGTMKTNTADDEALRAISEHVAVDLFPKSVIIVERNYLGIVVINHLLKVPGLEPRMFYLEKEKEAERTIGKMVVKSRKKVRVYGVDTTADSREAMFRHLFQIVDELPALLQSEYKKEAAEKKKAKAEDAKLQRAKDKEAGILESKNKAKEALREQQRKHEREFVQTVAGTMGWDPKTLEFPEDQYVHLSDAAQAKLRQQHHRAIMQRATEAVDLQRQRLVADHASRMEGGIGEVPLDAQDPETKEKK
jgi:hypothetical protein